MFNDITDAEREAARIEYTAMIGEVQQLCNAWRTRGMNGAVILARLLKMSISAAEAAGVSYEIVRQVVDSEFDKLPPVRPVVKA